MIKIKIVLLDPYVKISILDKSGARLKKKKTTTEKSTANPVFNQEIVFTNLKKEQLEDIVIHFSIYHDSIKHRELLGFVEISSASRGNQCVQWKNMIDCKKSIAWWNYLHAIDQSENEKNFLIPSLLHLRTRSPSFSFRKDSLNK